MEGPEVTAFLLYPPYTRLVVGQPLPAGPVVGGAGKKRKAAAKASKVQEPHSAASTDALEMLRLWQEDAPRWLLLSKAAWGARRAAAKKPSPPKAGKAKAAPVQGGAAPKPAAPTVTMADLVASGLLAAGSIVYLNAFGMVHEASIMTSGRLVDGTNKSEHTNPSAWALHVKRRTQPGLRTEAGWRNVRLGSVSGQPLEELKKAFLARSAAHTSP